MQRSRFNYRIKNAKNDRIVFLILYLTNYIDELNLPYKKFLLYNYLKIISNYKFIMFYIIVNSKFNIPDKI